jgi:hypothetical protein
MHRLALVAGLGLLAAAGHAQSRTSPAGRQDLSMTCPAQLGTGARTGRVFCDVLVAAEASAGVLIELPKRRTGGTLVFDLHTRYTYSAEQERAGAAFARQTATIAVVTLEGRVLSRAVVQAEVRGERDLFDRITGGAGPSGLKAVAPAGAETVLIEVPATVGTVSLVGEQLVVRTLRGEEVYTTAGRPVAVVSRPVLELPGRASAPARRSRRR